MIAFSSRARFHAHENRLTAALADARGRGQPLVDLTESNPTRAGLSPDARALSHALDDRRVAEYEPSPFGLASARTAVAASLTAAGIATRADQILLTASTSEAYSYLLRLLCDPGDSVLVPAPSYPLLDVLAQLEQVRLIPYPLAYDGEWHVDTAKLASACDATTRAIVTVHPNNPTGSYLKHDELDALAALGLPIISDEVFADYPLVDDPARAESALLARDRALVFRLGGLSKSVALPQLKLAWTVIDGPEPLAAEARNRLEHIADAYLSPGAQVQLALPRLLALGAPVRERLLARVRTNLAALDHAVRGTAITRMRVEGGWYAILRVPAVCDDEQWALTLLADDSVLVQPGYYYDLRGAHLVLSLIALPAQFAEGVRRLVARVGIVAR